jgi:hypothetical protein
MPEQTSNVEFAQKIHEQSHHRTPSGPSHRRWVELIEAAVLAIVAVATAWSGYQATKWDAFSDENYSLASRANVLAQEKATLAGQDRLYDIVTFNGWVAAENAGNKKLTALFEHRFRPEYAVAFRAWQKLDPLNNPSAPAGPLFMPEYSSASAQESKKLIEEGKSYFDKAVTTRENGDHYVKITVFLATVLLLTALGQRFEMFAPRLIVLTIAFLLLTISTFWIVTFPRI